MKYSVGQKFNYFGMEHEIKAITDQGKYLIAKTHVDADLYENSSEILTMDPSHFAEIADGFAIMLK